MTGQSRRSGPFLLGFGLLLSVACGTPSAPRQAASPLQTGPTATSPSPSPTATHSPEYPGLVRFSDPIDRLSYKLAYADCQTLGIDELSRSYGGDPNDPASAAQAYVAAANPSRAGAAIQGCLDALGEPSPG